jgi:hypothetical protein
MLNGGDISEQNYIILIRKNCQCRLLFFIYLVLSTMVFLLNAELQFSVKISQNSKVHN